MFQRIARRHPDRSDEAVASEAGEGAATTGGQPAPEQPPGAVDAGDGTPPAEALTERIQPVTPPPTSGDQPTTFQRPVAAPTEQPTTAQPSAPGVLPAGASPPAATGAPATPGPAPAAAATTPAGEVQAAASAAPAEAEPAPRRPGFRARGRMRRRLRYLRKLREVQVRDLGGLAFDLRRFERKRDDLVAQKIDQIRACDDELRALELTLDERRDLRDVREPGIGGTCPRCFSIFGSADRFCSSCGAALGGAVQGPAQVPPAPAPVQPPAVQAPPPAAAQSAPTPAAAPVPPPPASPPGAGSAGPSR